MSVITKRFINYAERKQQFMTLKEYILMKRKEFIPDYTQLSRREKKKKLGTMRNPSRDFAHYLFSQTFIKNITLELE